MGDNVDDILCLFHFSDSKYYDSVVSAFDSNIFKRWYVIYELAKFNQRRQEPGEPFGAFITTLYGLAECCRNALHEKIINSDCCQPLRSNTVKETAHTPGPNVESRVHQAEAIQQQQALVCG